MRLQSEAHNSVTRGRAQPQAQTMQHVTEREQNQRKCTESKRGRKRKKQKERKRKTKRLRGHTSGLFMYDSIINGMAEAAAVRTPSSKINLMCSMMRGSISLTTRAKCGPSAWAYDASVSNASLCNSAVRQKEDTIRKMLQQTSSLQAARS